MATPVKIRRSGTATATPSSLEHGELAINYADKTLYFKDSTDAIQSFVFQSYALATHAHAASDITSGTLDSARLPLATTGAAGAMIVGTGLGVSSGTVSVTYGTSSGTACEGNDARLSDARTPTSHTHGSISNDGAIGFDADQFIVTTTDGVLTAVNASVARSTLGVQPTASPAFTGAATFENTGNVVPLTVTNAGTANSFVVNDASGDTSPFVIDASGNVGVGIVPTLPLSAYSSATADSNKATLLLSGTTAGSQSFAGVRFSHNVFTTGWAADILCVDTGNFGGILSFRTSATGSATATPTERMRIDASGNVGIGGAPSSPCHIRANTINDGVLHVEQDGTGSASVRCDYDGTGARSWIFGTAGSGYRGGGFGGEFFLYDETAAAERLRISSTGTATFAGQVLVTAGSVSACSMAPSGDPNTGLYFPAANVAAIVTDGTERVRVNADGELMVGSTTDQGAFKLQVTNSAWIDNLYLSTTTNWGRLSINHNGTTTFAAGWNNTDTGSAGQTTLNILRNGTSVGSITTTNAATAFNTSSDYRLKEDVQSMANATARLSSLRPVTWQWRVGGVGEGFLAHELAAQVPLAVTGEKDAVGDDGKPIWQSVDMSKLVPLLVAALQESNARIAALEERLNHA